MSRMPFKKILSTFFLAALVYPGVYAQDTLSRQTVEIISTYKPHLRNAVKINFSASPLAADTSAPRLAYNIPAQNLFFTHRPVVLQPQSLTIDTTVLLGNRNYVKAGFGNFTTPYIEAALGFGNVKDGLFNIYGDYISSRGKIKNQDFSKINLKASGNIGIDKNELYGSFGISTNEQYLYGYDHDLFDYAKKDIRRSYRNMTLTAGFRNREVNDLGINFDPHIELNAFTRENKVDESTLYANLPAEKAFGDNMKIKLAIMANVNGYKINSMSLKLTNSLFQISPSFEYRNEIFKLNAGITPSWNNSESALLPNIYGVFQLQENVIAIQGGWVGRYIANSYRTLTGVNPFIADPVFLYNTKEVQYYGGIKATLGDHFNFNAKAAFIKYTNMPLYMNDGTDPKDFLLVNESNVNDFQIHGDMNFVKQDKFSVTAGVDVNYYSGLKNNSFAWGLYPLKLTGSIRWNVIDQLLVKGDFITFSGAKAMRNGTDVSLNGGTDLSIGAEFRITDMFSAWLDLNNILNSKYQWWERYPVYGLQAIGGVIVRF